MLEDILATNKTIWGSVMKQTVIIISGSPCVGKTTVAKEVFELLDNCAYLDGDWAWCVNPFTVEDPRLRDGDKNMSFILSTYLESQFQYVIFSSVVATDQGIREKIIKDISYSDFHILGITLTCSKSTLIERRQIRGDEGDISFRWLEMPPYPGDLVIDTDNKSALDIAKEICSLLKE